MSDLHEVQQRFRERLEVIFQFDKAELDFGIYRILRLRREELVRFLDRDLLPAVREILREAASTGAESPRVQGGAEQTSSGRDNQDSTDVDAIAADVFSDLTTFFARYYKDGDFVPLPRRKDSYAIPYNGTETKLHWATTDQFYVKSAESYAEYTAVLPSAAGLTEPRIRFRTVQATEPTKSSDSKELRYLLWAEEPVLRDGNTVSCQFEHRSPTARERGTQAQCNAAAEAQIIELVPLAWRKILSSQRTETFTELGWHLSRFTRRNTSDYFIHKELGRFLRRELDQFIKNEVLHLDDFDTRSVADLMTASRKVAAIRMVGSKIIDWLDQSEAFQKRLFLKKKFVLRTDWVLTLDRIPEALRNEVFRNPMQRSAWKELFDIGEKTSISKDPSYERLPVETRFFDTEFTWRLLALLGPEFDKRVGAVLVHGDNFQALRLLEPAFRDRCGLVYIDPPFNTGNDGFLYRDEYKHSSWLSMMHDRLTVGRRLLAEDGLFLCSISDAELQGLRYLQDEVFGSDNHVATAVWNTEGNIDNQSRIKINHEYITAYARQEGAWPAPQVIDPSIPAGSKLYNETIANSITKNGPANPISTVELPAGFPCDFEEGELEPVPKRWPKLSGKVRVKRGKTIDAVKATSGWSSRALLDEFIEKGMKDIKDAGGRRAWFRLTETGAIYFYKERGDEQSHVLSVIRNVGTTKLMSSALERLGLSFNYPKPVKLIEYLCKWRNGKSGWWVDYFAGSGTTGHAVMNANRKDGGDRKFFLVEAGQHFDEVLLPRLMKCAYMEVTGEQGSSPRVAPLSYTFRIVRLETYDDTLDNLALTRSDAVQTLLDSGPVEMRAGYLLQYMLGKESKPSLLNVVNFKRPFKYCVRARRNGVVEEVPVDLVESFNALIGLEVDRYLSGDGFRGVLGTAGEHRVLVFWRDAEVLPNGKLEVAFRTAFPPEALAGVETVFVNGDSHLQSVRRESESWTVRPIEEEFYRAMFDVGELS